MIRATLFFRAAIVSAFLLIIVLLLLLRWHMMTEVKVSLTPELSAPEPLPTTFPTGLGQLGDLVKPPLGAVTLATIDIPQEAPIPISSTEKSTWISQQNPEDYTIQLLMLKDEGLAKEFVAKHSDKGLQLLFISKPEAFAVVSGHYNTREAAIADIAAKFADMKEKPFPKKISAYMTDGAK
jgi:hypothetical protein